MRLLSPVALLTLNQFNIFTSNPSLPLIGPDQTTNLPSLPTMDPDLLHLMCVLFRVLAGIPDTHYPVGSTSDEVEIALEGDRVNVFHSARHANRPSSC